MIDIETHIPVFLQFANSLSVALVLTFIAVLFRQRWEVKAGPLSTAVDGVIFGAIGIMVMFFPFSLEPGAGLDVRVVPVVLAGPFGGPGAAVIAGLMVAGYRLYIGGPGVVAGVGAVLTVAAISVFIARSWERMAERMGIWYLLLVGFSLVVATFGWTLLLPGDLVVQSLRTYALPVAVSHPLGVVVLGALLLHEARRRRAERSLRESEARFRAIIDTSPSSIFLKDTEGRYTLVNKVFAQRFAMRPEDIVGHDAGLFVGPEIAEKVRERDRQIVEQGITITSEFDMPYADGEIHNEITAKFPLRDDTGKIVAIGGIDTDITELKRAETEARTLRDDLAHVARLSMMGEMATGFAHELNQPLTAINNYAQGALRRLRRPGARSEDLVPVLENLSRQAERAGQVIRRIRWFVQKNAPVKAPMDVNQAILNAMAFLNDAIAGMSVRLNLDLDNTIPEISADMVQIQQVLINLGRNALDAMQAVDPETRSLEFTTRATADSEIVVTVSDTGPGIAPEIRSELFEPFVTTKPEGLGIGLAICRSLIQAHGGEMKAVPRDGGGTSFRFTLPVASAP